MHLNIKVKMVIVAIVILAASICFLSIFTNTRSSQLYSQQMAASNQQILNQLSYNLNDYLDEIFRLTRMPYYNQNVMNLLRTHSQTLQERLHKRHAIEDFLIATMVFPRKDIYRVNIIADESYFSDRVGSPVPHYADQLQTQWYKRIMLEKEPLVIFPENGEEYFSVVNVIRDLFDFSAVLGVIKVDANFNTLRQLCETVDMGADGGVIILQEANLPLYSSLSPGLTSDVLEEYAAMVHTGEAHPIYSKNYLYNQVPLARFGWKVVTADSLDRIQSVHSHIFQTTLLFSLGILVVASVLLYLLMQYLFRPFFSIIRLMKTIDADDFSVRYHVTRKDEIGYLGATLNTMLDHIDEMYNKNAKLDRQVLQAQLYRKETQIQLLYSQIRPHFIYNTLNMISIRIQNNQLEEAVENINELSLILRGVAYINKIITLETELRLIDSYLSIQRSRFGDKLSYEIAIPASQRDYVMPSFILQPIVENAVVHSGETTHQKIRIRISSVQSDCLTIIIADSGYGISPEKTAYLNAQMRKSMDPESPPITDLSTAGGLGLINVNERIRMRFGPAYGLNIDSVVDRGTTVYVRLPLNDKAVIDIDSHPDR